MFKYPWGNLQGLNLAWFLEKFNQLLEDWATAEAGIDGALDDEIQKAEDALSDVFDARDAAAASATAAAGSASQAGTSATAAQNSATAAASSATLANNKATAAGLSEANAAQSASQAALSATNAGNSATAAGNSATAAGNSATAAGNSATAAGNSASAAAISETNAAQSAADAEAAAQSIPSDYSALTKALATMPDNFTPFAILPNYGEIATPTVTAKITKNVAEFEQIAAGNANVGINILTPENSGASITAEYLRSKGFKIPAASLVKFTSECLYSTKIDDNTTRTAEIGLRIYYIDYNENMTYDGFSIAQRIGRIDTKYFFNTSDDCYLLPVFIRTGTTMEVGDKVKIRYTIKVYNLIADSNIAANTYFAIDDQLFKSASLPIAKNDRITINSNAILRTLPQALNNL